ncbi:uncharacterized protein LOC119189830 [Manduca sexta]|uniref:uncharacterized protein LOC119189830 n=1 Tax=Manduca sexta TaxID=7130 RepID=UPI00188E7D35|nr:uncharacterized protein LOC119189830 [Manduca sexta]
MQINTSRRKASTGQLSYLAEHMKSHSDMASGISHTLQGRANLETLWENLTTNLNSLGGPIRTVAKWKQTWRDLRNNVKRKESYNKREYRGYGPGSTGNGPPTIKKLSQVEEQVLSIIGSVAVHGMEEIACTEPIIPDAKLTGLDLPQPSSPLPPAYQENQLPPPTVEQDFTFVDQKMTLPLAKPEILDSPLPVVPGPSLKHAPSTIKKRIVKRHGKMVHFFFIHKYK